MFKFCGTGLLSRQECGDDNLSLSCELIPMGFGDFMDDAVGKPELVDDAGKSHDWKSELVAHLAKLQQPDGSWVNAQPRWLENDPNLVTGYVLLALSYCK